MKCINRSVILLFLTVVSVFPLAVLERKASYCGRGLFWTPRLPFGIEPLWFGSRKLEFYDEHGLGVLLTGTPLTSPRGEVRVKSVSNYIFHADRILVFFNSEKQGEFVAVLDEQNQIYGNIPAFPMPEYQKTLDPDPTYLEGKRKFCTVGDFGRYWLVYRLFLIVLAVVCPLTEFWIRLWTNFITGGSWKSR